MKKIFICIAACLAMITASAQEEEHIETDRPSETETPHLVKPKYFQIETGIYYEKMSDFSFKIARPTALVKYGVGKKLELRVQLDYSTQTAHYIPNDKITRGMEPFEAGIKAALWEEHKWIPQTSFILQAGFPALASAPFREDYLSPDMRLLFKNTISKGFSVSYNAGLQWEGSEKTPRWEYTVTPEIDISKHLFVFAEVFGYLGNHEPEEHTVDAGLEYFLNNDFVLDIAYGVGLNAAAPKMFLNVGGSIRFK